MGEKDGLWYKDDDFTEDDMYRWCYVGSQQIT